MWQQECRASFNQAEVKSNATICHIFCWLWISQHTMDLKLFQTRRPCMYISQTVNLEWKSKFCVSIIFQNRQRTLLSKILFKTFSLYPAPTDRPGPRYWFPNESLREMSCEERSCNGLCPGIWFIVLCTPNPAWFGH